MRLLKIRNVWLRRLAIIVTFVPITVVFTILVMLEYIWTMMKAAKFCWTYRHPPEVDFAVNQGGEVMTPEQAVRTVA